MNLIGGGGGQCAVIQWGGLIDILRKRKLCGKDLRARKQAWGLEIRKQFLPITGNQCLCNLIVFLHDKLLLIEPSILSSRLICCWESLNLCGRRRKRAVVTNATEIWRETTTRCRHVVIATSARKKKMAQKTRATNDVHG